MPEFARGADQVRDVPAAAAGENRKTHGDSLQPERLPHQRRLSAAVAVARPGFQIAELDLGGRSVKGQMKQADRVGARAAIVLDEDGGAQLRNMTSGEQREIELDRVADELMVP
jgi:histidyl-tRNA synthetase